MLAVILIVTALQSDAVQLAIAQSRWAARPFSHYRLVIEFAALERCRQDVEMENETILAVLENTCSHPPITVADLFNQIETVINANACGPNGCACDGPIGADVVYDEQLGYPQRLQIRPMLERRYRYWEYLWGGFQAKALVP